MKKILIVDDEEGMRYVLKANLVKNGFECFTAEDGFEAIKLTKEIKPDLIILDLMLPKLSGEEVCREIRKTEGFKEIPIIMLTAKDSDVDRVIGRVIGAEVYLTKPCDTHILLENINKLLELQK